jgi:hypothetical protein
MGSWGGMYVVVSDRGAMRMPCACACSGNITKCAWVMCIAEAWTAVGDFRMCDIHIADGWACRLLQGLASPGACAATGKDGWGHLLHSLRLHRGLVGRQLCRVFGSSKGFGGVESRTLRLGSMPCRRSHVTLM